MAAFETILGAAAGRIHLSALRARAFVLLNCTGGSAYCVTHERGSCLTV